VALDLDGTALRRDGTISGRLKRAVARCQSQGTAVILATGRMPQSALRYWNELQLKPGPLVSYQGAMVSSVPDGRVLAKTALTDAAARLAVQWALERELLTQVYVGSELWVSREDPRVRQYIDANHIPAWVRGAVELTDWPEAPIKILLQDDSAVLDRLRPELEAQLAGQPVRVFKSQPDYLEVVHEKVGKAQGLQEVARILGVEQARVLAVGDAENDLDMLRWAGFGVAMGQAPDIVQQAADAITGTVDADGAAEAIERWVLEVPPQ
jgi:Cof subfamily protein (haloacid dehalogenase superfamily)